MHTPVANEIAVGICTYNRPEYVDRAFTSLVSQTRQPDHLLVADDSDSEATRSILLDRRDELPNANITYLTSDGDTNLPLARNYLLEEVTEDVICYIDDDVVCEPKWLETIAETFDRYPNAVAVGGPAIRTDFDLVPLYEIRRDAENLGTISPRGVIDSHAGDWIPPEPVETDCLMGANMAFRTSELRDIGGFDPLYRGTSYAEEWDVFVQFWKENKQVIYHPDAAVNHTHANAGGTRSTKLIGGYWTGRNLIYLRRKHFADRFLWSCLPLLVGASTDWPPSLVRQCARAVVNRNPEALQLVKGYLDGFVLDRSLTSVTSDPPTYRSEVIKSTE